MEFSSAFIGKRLKTRSVKVGDIIIGGDAPIVMQTMTTTDTLDTQATVEQILRCVQAGAEMVRITAPSIKDAENLSNIRAALKAHNCTVPLVADIHFTPNAADVAAKLVDKVRINPGNYVDKKKFASIQYTQEAYEAELDRIRNRFIPFLEICKTHGTAIRIGTNHGSLSDRIMSYYGDTPVGMVESAMEFLRIARSVDFHQIVLSMKSSNPMVMVEAYRLLVKTMYHEFGECYPLHLGVTEAGDGEDGRIKSAIGIGTLLEEGIGDTIRVSLTEDPEFEIPVCRQLLARYKHAISGPWTSSQIEQACRPIMAFSREVEKKATLLDVSVPVVVSDLRSADAQSMTKIPSAIGFHYDTTLDKFHFSDLAPDAIALSEGSSLNVFPGSIQVLNITDTQWCLNQQTEGLVVWQANQEPQSFVATLQKGDLIIADIASTSDAFKLRQTVSVLIQQSCLNPIILKIDASATSTIDDSLIHFAVLSGALFLDGIGDGIWLVDKKAESVENIAKLNNIAFTILQATRKRISKTEYISCPSCGRTLFDLQETTAKIRLATQHLKGVKIAIMGCIVNGPGEMADADFGYVGSGPGKITLYKEKEVVKRNVSEEAAVDELIDLLKAHGAWVDKN